MGSDRFVAGKMRYVAQGSLDLKRRPESSSPLDSQLLLGEAVEVFEETSGWAWLQNQTDGYVGYVRVEGLSSTAATPTHQVSVPRGLLFPKPDLKTPIIDSLTLTSRVAVVETLGDYARLASGGWVHHAHLQPLATEPTHDFVASALRFLEIPYLWGGRSSLGLDCSGLVQLSLAQVGIASPRDSDMQEAELGEECSWPPTPEDPIQRGDLIFCSGHVAIAMDEDQIVHANAHHMAVAVESWQALDARLKARGEEGLRKRRRPPST